MWQSEAHAHVDVGPNMLLWRPLEVPQAQIYLQLVNEGGHDDVLVSVAVEVSYQRGGVYAGASLGHPLERHVLLAAAALWIHLLIAAAQKPGFEHPLPEIDKVSLRLIEAWN